MTRGTEPRAFPNGVVMAVLAIAGVTGSFMMTMVIPLQPQLPVLLDASAGDTAWIVTVTLLVSAIVTPIAGKLGDMYGKRLMILVLLGLVLMGSVIAALATTLGPVLFARALQGAGLAVIPLGVSILRDILPTRELGAATALVTASVGLGSSLAQPISAFLAEHVGWHAIFWVGAALAAVCFLLVRLTVPVRTRRSGGRFDFAGAVGLALGLTGVLLAVSRGNEWGWLSPSIAIPLVGGILALLLWGWFELRRANPLVDLRVTARRPVLLTNVASIGMGFSMFAGNIIFPRLLQQPEGAGGLGLSLFEASLIMMPSGFFAVGTSFVAGRFERTIGPKRLLLAGAAVVGGSYLTATFLQLSVWHVCVLNIGAAIGAGFAFAAMPALINRSVPASQTGAANGLNALMRSLGTSSAAAVLAAVLSANTLIYGQLVVPSADAYHAAILIVIGVAALSAVLAGFIPRTRPIPDEPLAAPESIV